MSRLNAKTMRPVEVKVAAAICRAHGEFRWQYLRDVEGNPSTAYAYYDYLRMGRAAVREVERLYAGGANCQGVEWGAARGNERGSVSHEIVTMYCNGPKCHWQGTPDELVCTDADPTHFTHCPQCEGEDLTEELEEVEEEEDE